MSKQVSHNCEKRGESSLFSFGLGLFGFALAMFFCFFIDLLTPRECKRLIENSLSGVSLRCQIGVIWFCLTLREDESVNLLKVLTPLIINELSIFGVIRCQFDNQASDTEEEFGYQTHSLSGVRSVRLFQEKSIVRI